MTPSKITSMHVAQPVRRATEARAAQRLARSKGCIEKIYLLDAERDVRRRELERPR